jgi:Cof subfamily protein (haloacid dehalogenase superfamily)
MKSFPYRLAAIDMDATLLGPDHRISPSNHAAAVRLLAHDVRIVLASGRRHENLIHFQAELGIDGPTISGNGALVRDTATGETWHEQLLDPGHASSLLESGLEAGVTQVVEHADGCSYLHETTRHSDILAFRTGNPMTICHEFGGIDRARIRKIIWIADPEFVRTASELQRSRWQGLLEVLVTDPEYLEHMAPGVDKVNALRVVARRTGIEQQQVLAFGDGGNDVAMLRWAGCGVAMAHGWEIARSAANRVSPPGDPGEAFARAVDQLLSDFA